MSKLFADTFYFIALLNKHDEAHEKAVEQAASMGELVTTEWVLTLTGDRHFEQAGFVALLK
jgi:predicted nucleic acid-binding protein